MNVTILLADAAQAINGKFYILGGGWNIRDSNPTPMALALLIEVPWTEANIAHRLQIVLLDEDGREVIVPTPTGAQPFRLEIPFEVGRPAGLQPGTPLHCPWLLILPHCLCSRRAGMYCAVQLTIRRKSIGKSVLPRFPALSSLHPSTTLCASSLLALSGPSPTPPARVSGKDRQAPSPGRRTRRAAGRRTSPPSGRYTSPVFSQATLSTSTRRRMSTLLRRGWGWRECHIVCSCDERVMPMVGPWWDLRQHMPSAFMILSPVFTEYPLGDSNTRPSD